MPADVFALSSRPTSTRTIYLDFDGATYSGTRWKSGAQIVSPAYSIDADPSTFSDERAGPDLPGLALVAEDYATFDVNVTTRRPDPSALARTTSADQTYGIPVVITPTNSVGSGCGCGGLSYVGVFGDVGATDYQPAWVFTQGSGTGGYNVGQIISHEVGHTFGLHHDGTSASGYYSGAKGWAPIMGSSYGRAPRTGRTGSTPERTTPRTTSRPSPPWPRPWPTTTPTAAVGATRLAAGTPVAGTITTRADTDAFTFIASGGTSLSVSGPSAFSNLDVQLTILDASGVTVATVDPTADMASDESLAPRGPSTCRRNPPPTPRSSTAPVSATLPSPAATATTAPSAATP